jgi:hypothetical protein
MILSVCRSIYTYWVLNKIHTTSTVESGIYNLANSAWVSPVVLDKIYALNTATSNSNSPIYSNNPNWVDKGFNKYTNFADEQPPRLLKSKEETAPAHLFSEYWSTVWANSSSQNRLQSNILSNTFRNNFYLPIIEEYAEYDFKNWQALEALEDCFWESTFSSFAQEDYLSSLNNFSSTSLLKKQEELYSSSTRSHKFKNSKLYKSLKPNNIINSLPIFSKEGFLNSPLVTKQNFISIYKKKDLESSFGYFHIIFFHRASGKISIN